MEVEAGAFLSEFSHAASSSSSSRVAAGRSSEESSGYVRLFLLRLERRRGIAAADDLRRLLPEDDALRVRLLRGWTAASEGFGCWETSEGTGRGCPRVFEIFWHFLQVCRCLFRVVSALGATDPRRTPSRSSKVLLSPPKDHSFLWESPPRDFCWLREDTALIPRPLLRFGDSSSSGDSNPDSFSISGRSWEEISSSWMWRRRSLSAKEPCRKPHHSSDNRSRWILERRTWSRTSSWYRVSQYSPIWSEVGWSNKTAKDQEAIQKRT